jgi:hypothetical protein
MREHKMPCQNIYRETSLCGAFPIFSTGQKSLKIDIERIIAGGGVRVVAFPWRPGAERRSSTSEDLHYHVHREMYYILS